MSQKFSIKNPIDRFGIPVLLLIACAVSFSLLVRSWGRPLTELHSFRQTQNAISVYWMLHGGPWLDYWTPVFGPPWSAPFEFPLYQWIVASTVYVTGLPIDDAGRLISFAWFMLGALPARALAKEFNFPPLAFPIFAVLILASPMYAYWGRAFMIETQALTLSLVFLLYARRAIENGRGLAVLIALAAGSAAALTKVTTAFPFFVVAAVLALRAFMGRHDGSSRARLTVRTAILLGLPVLVFLVWNHHADELKAGNEIAAMTRMSSPGMQTWNFGTFDQRLSTDLLVAQLRALIDMFGWSGPILLPLLLGLFAVSKPSQRDSLHTIVLFSLYILPWFVFTNLHIVHDYYQTAIGLFAIAAVANILAVVGSGSNRTAAIIFCAVLVVSQATRIASYQFTALGQEADWRLQIAEIVKAETRPDQIVRTYGFEWSPVLPYYAQRKAIMEPTWTPPEQYRRRLRDAVANENGETGAIVHCVSRLDDDPAVKQALITIARSSRVVPQGKCEIYLQPGSQRQ